MFINGEEAYPFRKNPNYYVTKSGKIYSILVKGGQGRIDINNPHPIAYGQDKDGYYRMVMSNKGNKRYVKVHTVMVEQFLGDIPQGLVVNHKDGNIHNNNISNLEIVTSGENTIHAHTIGLTSIEIPVNVVYNNNMYYFRSIHECISFFPDISRNYIMKLRKGIVDYSMVLFKKRDENNKHSLIDAYYNGNYYMTFNTMQDADKYFGMSKGTTSSAIKNKSEYRNKVNQYKIYIQ